MIIDDAGKRLFVCSDTDYCQERQAGAGDGRVSELPTGRCSPHGA